MWMQQGRNWHWGKIEFEFFVDLEITGNLHNQRLNSTLKSKWLCFYERNKTPKNNLKNIKKKKF